MKIGPASAWKTFLKERSPIGPMIGIGVAVSASTQYLSRSAIHWPAFFISTAFMAVFLTLLRVMDEVKDVEKDRQIHPERPLARGLITVDQARALVVRGLIGLTALCCLAALISAVAATMMIVAVFYGWLMYREFFVGAKLEKNVFVFGIVHQLIVLPLYLGIVALADVSGTISDTAAYYAWLALGCSFSFEICRKLNPASPALARTYVQVHGLAATVLAIVVCLGVVTISSHRLGLAPLVWPLVILQLGALALYAAKPTKYKLLEGFSVLTSLGQVLAPAVRAWLGWPAGGPP